MVSWIGEDNPGFFRWLGGILFIAAVLVTVMLYSIIYGAKLSEATLPIRTARLMSVAEAEPATFTIAPLTAQQEHHLAASAFREAVRMLIPFYVVILLVFLPYLLDHLPVKPRAIEDDDVPADEYKPTRRAPVRAIGEGEGW